MLPTSQTNIVISNCRTEFYINDKHYFKGSRVGPLCKRVENICQNNFNGWKEKGLYAMFENQWVYCDTPVRHKLSNILGCSFEEVVLPAQNSFNIHQIITKMYSDSEAQKRKIIVDFPIGETLDIVAIKSQLQLQEANEELVQNIKPDQGKMYVTEEDIQNYLELHHQDIQILFVQSVNPITGYSLNIQKVSQIAHNFDIIVGFDLTLSVGTTQLELSQWDIDFAVFSTQGYLSGGLNSYGAIFLNKKHFKRSNKQLSGWFGNKHETQWLMKPEYDPAEDAQMLITSGLSPFSLKIIECTLDLILEQTVQKIALDSKYLMSILFEGLEKICSSKFEIITPNQNVTNTITLKLNGYQASDISNLLQEKQIEVITYEQSNLLVISVFPLYNSEDDIINLIEAIRLVIQ